MEKGSETCPEHSIWYTQYNLIPLLVSNTLPFSTKYVKDQLDLYCHVSSQNLLLFVLLSDMVFLSVVVILLFVEMLCLCVHISNGIGDATVLEWFFRDNFVIFRRRSKIIAFFVISEFFYVNFQFSWWSRDHFSATFRGLLYLPNAWPQTLQTSKRHTFGVSAFHRSHCFGVKLFSVGCAQDSRRIP